MLKKLLIVIVSVLALLASSCSLSFTSAKFKNITVAAEVDDKDKPVAAVNVFETKSPIVYVTGTVTGAPEGTVIKAEWIYTENDPVYSIDSATITLKEATSDFKFSLNKPNSDWPVGAYEVKLYIDDKYIMSANFGVK